MIQEAISKEQIVQMKAAFESNAELKMRMGAVCTSGIDGSAANHERTVHTPHLFSHELKTGEITAQKSSGRCWLFAAMNTMRIEVMRRCGLETFELSQAYMMFWDKLEKANFFLESILDTVEEPLDGRLVSHFLKNPFSDGGQWNMIVSLVEKYGVVPKIVMPESFHSSNSARMNKFLTLKAREDAALLRSGYQEGKTKEELREWKGDMLCDFYNMLGICLGIPPSEFDFEYRDKEGRFVRDPGMTPHSFYRKYVGNVSEDYVSLINAPTADKPYHATFTVAYLGNVRGGRPVRYLNLPAEELRQAAIVQLLDGQPVWFGCDVAQMLDREKGIMAMDTYDYENLFQTSFNMKKAEKLDYCESGMSHAMVFMGVNLVDGKPNRWKVENSWGDSCGEKGWFVMSDEWFEEYCYQIVVNKKYLNERQKQEMEKEPIILKPWDPMGSLA